MSAGPRYLLDTNIIIAAMKGHPAVREKLENLPLDTLVLSPVVLGELEFGAEKSRYADRNRARLQKLTQRIPLLPLDRSVALAYGNIRNALESRGQPIGSNDQWIAAHATALGATMVTDNVREFSRINHLSIENWLE